MTLLRHLAAAIVAAGLLLLLSVKLDAFHDYQLAQVTYYTVAVAGLTILIGLSGQLSVGHGAFMFIGAYATALLLLHAHWPLEAVLAASAVIAALAGAIVGVAAARLRGPYLAGATLLLAVALPSITSRWQGLFGGDQGLGVAVNTPGFLGSTFPPTRWLAWVGCACGLITFVLLANLRHSRIGRSWRAVRDDEVAASLSGLNVARLQVLAFVVSSACAGLGGALLAMVNSSATPGTFALTLSIQLLTAAILGGLGGRGLGQPGPGLPGALHHQRGHQPRPVRQRRRQHPDRGVRRRADLGHAAVPQRDPGRPAPPVRAGRACGGRSLQRLAPARAGI